METRDRRLMRMGCAELQKYLTGHTNDRGIWLVFELLLLITHQFNRMVPSVFSSGTWLKIFQILTVKKTKNIRRKAKYGVTVK
uniref:Uncharacterized protein n=1 Tax=Pararge aegeria TaxID=116150 RepID=S4NZM8_9NEOP